MLTIISKLLAIPFYPAGLSLVLLSAGLVGVVLKRRRLSIWCVSAGIGVLLVFSCPLTAYLLVRSLERRYDPPASFPPATAVVLLGGGGVSPSPPRRHPETNVWGDRLLHAARLYRQGCAHYVIVTGGTLPFVYEGGWTDARNYATLLTELWDIDTVSRVLKADRSQTTHEDALEVVRVIGELQMPYDIILVTSAMHMHRSVRLMEKQGLTVYPAPTDYHVDAAFQWKLYNLLPNAMALYECQLALHEYYGLIAYRILGWI